MKKRLLTCLLTAAMLVSLFPLPALAAEAERPEWMVTAFDPLDGDTAAQTVPQGGEPVLPDSLTAWAYAIEDDTEVIPLPEETEQESEQPQTDGPEEAEDNQLPVDGQEGPEDEQPQTDEPEVEQLPSDSTGEPLAPGEVLTDTMVENDPEPAEKQEPDIQPVTIPGVTWEAQPEFDPDAPGEYVYTPVLPAAYEVAMEVELPVIFVTVTAAEQTALQRVQAMIDALPAPEDITPDNRDEVEAQLEAIGEAWAELSEEDALLLDTARLEAARDAQTGNELPAPLADGTDDFTVTGGALNTDYSYADNTLTILKGTALTISGSTTTDKIVIADGVAANVTLQNVSIDVSGTSEACAFEVAESASCTLTLTETNTLKSGDKKAGLQVQTSASLTITEASNGSLNATGGTGGAGIGGGYYGAGGTITINGGTVTATGGTGGAGIGGGEGGNGVKITISGGIVKATGGKGTTDKYSCGGAGIGNGWNGSGCTVTIHGGTVEATGGNGRDGIRIGLDSSEERHGAHGGNGIENAVIGTDAVVTATGGDGGKGTQRWPKGGNGGNGGHGLYSCTVQGGLVSCSYGWHGGAGQGMLDASSGSRGNPGYPLKDCIVNGGSIKHTNDPENLKNGAGEELSRGTLTASDVTSVSVDGIPWYIPKNHADGNELYLYMTREDHQVQVRTKDGVVTAYTAEYNNFSFNFTKGNSTTPAQKPNVSVSLNKGKVTYGSEDLVEVTVEIGSSTNRAVQSRAIMDSVLVTVTGEGGRQMSVRQYANVQNGKASVSLDVSDYPAGAYTVTAVYGGSADLTEAEGTAELKITKKEVTASINSSTTTKIYDGNNNGPDGLSIKLENVLTDDDVSATATSFTYKDADVGENKTITANNITLGGKDKDNYTLGNNKELTINGNITPKKLGASIVGNTTKTYDGNTDAPFDLKIELKDVVSGDDVSATATVAYNSADVINAKTITARDITLSGDDSSNYTLGGHRELTINGNITQRALDASIAGNTTKPYDGTADAPSGLKIDLTGVVLGDDVSATATSFSYNNADVGENKTITASDITLNGSKAGNYKLNSDTVSIYTGTITKSDSSLDTPAINAQKVTYGDTFTVSFTPKMLKQENFFARMFSRTSAPAETAQLYLNGELLAEQTDVTENTLVTFTVDTTKISAEAFDGSKQTLTIQWGGDDNLNASESSVEAKFNKKELTATISGTATKTYDGNTTATGLGITLADVVLGDTVSATATSYTYDNANVGTGKTITASGITLTGTSADYYTLKSNTATITTGSITQATISGALTISGTAAYGQELTAVYTPASGETVSYQWKRSSTAIDGATGSTYTLTADDIGQTITVTATATDGNHTGSVTSGATAAVAKATPTVKVEVALSGSTGAREAVLTVTVTGVTGGAAPTGTVTLTGNNGLSETLTLNDGTASHPWSGLAEGDYTVTAEYGGDSSYDTARANKTFNTNKQEQDTLAIGSVGNKTYGDPAFSLSTTGGSGSGAVTFTSSDPSVISINGTTATIRTAGGPVTITATKAEDEHYNAATATLTVYVAKKAVVFKANDKTVQQGGTMPTFDYAPVTLAQGDSITTEPIAACTATDTNTTGTFPITLSGAVLSNGDSYDISYQPGTLTVTAKPSTGGGGGGWYNSPTTYSVTIPTTAHGKVAVSPTSASRGATVTITAVPEDGYRLDTLNVTSGGKSVPLTEKGNGKYTFTMPTGTVKVEAVFVLAETPETPWNNPFADVSEGDWYYEAVQFVQERGLMNGYSDGRFGPNDTLSRAQLAQILFNKEGRPGVNYLMDFSDVAGEAWYTEAVRWATSQGIVNGYGNGTFGPDDPITREQLAVMLWRYVGSPAATNKELHFADADEISPFALEAMRWAVENGILNGYGDGRLGPQGQATRAQVAQMLKNFIENQEANT